MIFLRSLSLCLVLCFSLVSCWDWEYNPELGLHSSGGGLWSDSEGRSGSFESEIEISVPDSSIDKVLLRYDLTSVNGEGHVVEFFYDNSAIANSKADVFDLEGNKIGVLRVGESIVAKLHDNDQTIDLDVELSALRGTGVLPVTGKITHNDGHFFTWSDSLSVGE